MKINNRMKKLLEQYGIHPTDPITPISTYPIWCKADASGRSYWGVSNFCGMDAQPIPLDQDLSQLEWDGNEVYLDASSNDEVRGILTQALGIMAYWKRELEDQYPKEGFYLLASYSSGDGLFLGEDESPTESITLRFWAWRRSNTVLSLEGFENWKQPSIIESCNPVP